MGRPGKQTVEASDKQTRRGGGQGRGHIDPLGRENNNFGIGPTDTWEAPKANCSKSREATDVHAETEILLSKLGLNQLQAKYSENFNLDNS